jgi:ATP phosphoribosyltransferase
LGITGQDMVAEADLNGLIEEICPLNFGKCSLQVQVPINSEVKSLDQLSGKKIVTSFEVVSKSFFKGLDDTVNASHSESQPKATFIEYIGGSVEAACALGLADGIVDLVGKLMVLGVFKAVLLVCSCKKLTPCGFYV